MVDYTFYRGKYKGKLPQDEFISLVDNATFIVSAMTFIRSENPPEIMKEHVKLCICEIIDAESSYKASESLIPKGTKNISNDGYSVSNLNKTEKEKQKDYQAICRKYLLMPVNLMATWI